MAAKGSASRAGFGSTSAFGSRAAARRASSQSATSGHWRPQLAAAFKYSGTVLWPTEQLSAIWRCVFPQQRTSVRGVRQSLGSLIRLGRRCLTRIIWTNGGQASSWSAEYFLHSPCKWEPQELFRPILKSALEYCPQRLAGGALDDTKLRKAGRSIQQALYQRDPMSPPFHLNLVLACASCRLAAGAAEQ